MLHPGPGEPGAGNDRSLVIQARAGGRSLLLTGDIPASTFDCKIVIIGVATETVKDVSQFRFSGDGRRVLTVEWRPTVVTVWDAGTGARITRFTIPVSNSRAVDVDDIQAQVIARDIAKQVEEELQYPGQIKVVVIRETRAVDFAR